MVLGAPAPYLVHFKPQGQGGQVGPLPHRGECTLTLFLQTSLGLQRGGGAGPFLMSVSTLCMVAFLFSMDESAFN